MRFQSMILLSLFHFGFNNYDTLPSNYYNMIMIDLEQQGDRRERVLALTDENNRA